MNPIFFTFLLLSTWDTTAQDTKPPTTSHISVLGSVFCDTCHANSFSTQSYFLPGVEVHVQCKFKANSPKATEQISFSVNRTTDRYGIYRLDIPSVEGVDCVEVPAIQSFCQASLVHSTSSACNVPGFKATANEITVKSKQDNLCIYSLSALSYVPQDKNFTLCGKNVKEKEEEMKFSAASFNSSKFFLPYFPPYYGFPWPPLPELPPLPKLPPLPQLPPFPQFPFPPLPPLPFPFPSLPFPNPPSLPPPLSPAAPSPPPYFDFRDPRTWIPNIPDFSPPSPPQAQIPPPPPPTFNLRDPRTWLPSRPPPPSTDP